MNDTKPYDPLIEYRHGYDDRYNGKSNRQDGNGFSSDPKVQDYIRGWDDANTEIISMQRQHQRKHML